MVVRLRRRGMRTLWTRVYMVLAVYAQHLGGCNGGRLNVKNPAKTQVDAQIRITVELFLHFYFNFVRARRYMRGEEVSTRKYHMNNQKKKTR